RRAGWSCDGEVAEGFDDMVPAWSRARYRIVPEAPTTITKQAHGSRVHIALRREPSGIRLRVVDAGVGLAEGATAKPKSHGIVGMRERMRQLGGKFTIAPGPGNKGTLVEAFIPSDSENASQDVGNILRTAS